MKKEVRVTQIIEVTIDEDKFDDVFMEEFRESFYNFQSIDDHIEHLAQLYARGITDGSSKSFIEGYGFCEDMSIGFKVVDTEIDMDWIIYMKK